MNTIIEFAEMLLHDLDDNEGHTIDFELISEAACLLKMLKVLKECDYDE